MIPSGDGPEYFNRKVERKLLELGGTKALYSTSYYDEDTFWQIYPRKSYYEIKGKFDPEAAFQDLYAVVVGNV